MSYTDLTSTWVYKGLVEWKSMDAHGENSDVVYQRIKAAARPLVKASYSGFPQAISDNVFTKLTLNVESFDTLSVFSSSRFTPGIAGVYCIDLTFFIQTATVATDWHSWGALYKNGSLLYYCPYTYATGDLNMKNYPKATFIVRATATDYFEAFGYIREPTLAGGGLQDGFFSAQRICS